MYRVYSKTLDADILLVGLLIPSIRMLQFLDIERVDAPTPGKETLELGASVGQLERMYSKMGVLFEKSRQGYNSLAIRKQGIDFVYWYRPEVSPGALLLYEAGWKKDGEGNYTKLPRGELVDAPAISIDLQALSFKLKSFFDPHGGPARPRDTVVLGNPLLTNWNLGQKGLLRKGVIGKTFDYTFFAKVRETEPAALHDDNRLSLLLALDILEQRE